MILAIDVHYRPTEAKIVGLLFKHWADTQATEVITTFVTEVAEYEPGAFYKREMPCIIALLPLVDIDTLDYIVIDGYVYLNDDDKKGLGYYVFDHFDGKIPIIGVAKTSFHQNTKNVRPILRGGSANPLYVTSIGIAVDEAAKMIQSMAGDFRMPTLLKLMDTITKE